MVKVLVLLSTYNGEKYLHEQLNSLLNQKGVEVTVMVRDDGSKDRTVEIIEEYQQKTKQFILLRGDNCGSCNSFFKLMKEGCKYRDEYDYFAFCDQDDVWLDDKLEAAVKILDNNVVESIPGLYMSAYQMVDADLNRIETPVRIPKLSLPAAFASNCATGCTMVFNSELLAAASIACNTKDVIMHDYWVYLVCLAKGGFVYYDSVPHILYRQHGNNVIGGIGDSFLKRWMVRMKKLFKRGDCFKSKLAAELSMAINQIHANSGLFLEKLSTPKKNSSKFYLLSCKDFWTGGFEINLKNLGLLITGKI